MKHQNRAYYDAVIHPTTCAPDDFWGQVRRTVKGKPIGQDQIDLIVRQAREVLGFQPRDVLLDLCCGNGALSRYFFEDCSEFLGVDQSPPLIDVAKRNFENPPRFLFLQSDLLEYLRQEDNPGRFTKALWYGAFSYFSREGAAEALELLFRRFTGARTIYIAPIPDLDRAAEFYPAGKDYEGELTDHTTSIGRWWTRDEVCGLSTKAGWRVEVSFFQKEYYQAHYRFYAKLWR